MFGLFKKKQPDGLTLAGKFDGHTVWYYDRIERLPSRRYLYFLSNTREAELGVTRNDLKRFIENIREAVNTNQHTKTAWFVETLDFYLETYTPEKLLFKSGSVLLLIDDENPKEVSDKYMQIKASLFDNNEDFKVFFCRITFQVLKKYGVLSKDTSAEDFLREAMAETANERIYSELTGRRIYWDYLSG